MKRRAREIEGEQEVGTVISCQVGWMMLSTNSNINKIIKLIDNVKQVL